MKFACDQCEYKAKSNDCLKFIMVFDVKDILCPNLGLTWEDRFTILGFEIDSKLKDLKDNFDRINKRVLGLILKWQCYQLTTDGKITIAKSLLLSQYTYIGSVLEISDTRAKHIQDNLNSFIFHNKPNKAGAKVYIHVKEEVLYGRKSEGGFGMIRVDDFFNGLKCSWIKIAKR